MALGVVSPALAQSSIGFVSLERILREAPAAQRAQKKLEQEFAQRGQELSKMAEQLKKMQENLEKNAVTMPESERQKREREFGDINRDFQRKQREFNVDLGHRRKEELKGSSKRQPGRVR
jgi:outer membrane protein